MCCHLKFKKDKSRLFQNNELPGPIVVVSIQERDRDGIHRCLYTFSLDFGVNISIWTQLTIVNTKQFGVKNSVLVDNEHMNVEN